MNSTRGKRKRQGYVLVMTLFVLSVVALLLTTLASRSIFEATAAVQLETEVANKWAIASCQRFALTNAEDLLVESEGEFPNALPDSQATVSLAGITIDMQLEDESAKLDLNNVWANTSAANTREVARRFGPPEANVELRPLRSDLQSMTNDPFESWGQVFVPATTAESGIQAYQASRDLTLWSKKTNFETAPADVILETAKPVAGTIIAQRLASAAASGEQTSFEDALNAASPTQRQQDELRKLFTERSHAQSLWMFIREQDQTSLRLTIRESFTDTIHRTYSFSW
ncbi:MAG: hypothetical protein AAF456_18010 [Planctomycetota bacterium]